MLEEAEAQGVRLVTVSEGLERVEPVARELVASTWGNGKDLSTWDSPRGGGAGLRGAGAPSCAPSRPRRRDAAPHAALERAARELLAMQSSDWAFMVTRELAADYPAEADGAHGAAHDAALAALTDSAPAPEPSLRNLAPHLDLAP